MKFLALPPLALLGLASAQQISIESPRPGTTLHRNRPTDMVVQTQNNGTVQEVSVVLSILPCPDGTCPNAGEDLGTILSAGPFQPTGQPPEQKFSINIPESFPVGYAELLATHFVLTGVSYPDLVGGGT
ncbi:hypothetical protein MAC_01224 [Metarhizium acridum CQMa 102]|uniref:Uncharacterized protein n=1 Tax=Metarhizium acridum (strain CQMa 102) TaxID=655827 RepID=E9DUC6_METAQ|nr:uncharacterized protein MAC_01224 [Metarhizium acridum CQMa 102]EFY92588.1 hypothetical protein MAC_01224 [Metarhizium acridum CQMa 102]